MNNSRLFRLSRIVIALTAASGMMVNTANATDEAKAATQYTQQVNQNYAKSLPFSDRQDFDDAQHRGERQHDGAFGQADRAGHGFALVHGDSSLSQCPGTG